MTHAALDVRKYGQRCKQTPVLSLSLQDEPLKIHFNISVDARANINTTNIKYDHQCSEDTHTDTHTQCSSQRTVIVQHHYITDIKDIWSNRSIKALKSL